MRKFKLERHEYAPELNKIHFEGGAVMPAPGIRTIQDARRKYFAPLKKRGKYAVIEYRNDEHPCLNQTYRGFCGNGYRSIRAVLKHAQKRHNVPGGTFDISIKYVG